MPGGGDPAAQPRDVEALAGTWSGVAERGKQDDYVEITIRPDRTFVVVSHRTIGVYRGHGVLVPAADGYLMRGEAGGGTLALGRDRAGEPVLRLDATLGTSQRVSADLRRAK
jgi:hypothetical protein